jgi:hypothetical protein
MSRDQRISQPKRNGDISERRKSNVDSFMNQPQVVRNGNGNVLASLNRTIDDGNSPTPIPVMNNSKSQERYSANPEGKQFHKLTII